MVCNVSINKYNTIFKSLGPYLIMNSYYFFI
uniref:Uncharacterized protein n=1 Tax=Heterorhabditis bacteriophora TaxID=37862 RepID=A0A1I7WUF3_HETBA